MTPRTSSEGAPATDSRIDEAIEAIVRDLPLPGPVKQVARVRLRELVNAVIARARQT